MLHLCLSKYVSNISKTSAGISSVKRMNLDIQCMRRKITSDMDIQWNCKRRSLVIWISNEIIGRSLVIWTSFSISLVIFLQCFIGYQDSSTWLLIGRKTMNYLWVWEHVLAPEMWYILCQIVFFSLPNSCRYQKNIFQVL